MRRNWRGGIAVALVFVGVLIADLAILAGVIWVVVSTLRWMEVL